MACNAPPRFAGTPYEGEYLAFIWHTMAAIYEAIVEDSPFPGRVEAHRIEPARHFDQNAQLFVQRQATLSGPRLQHAVDLPLDLLLADHAKVELLFEVKQLLHLTREQAADGDAGVHPSRGGPSLLGSSRHHAPRRVERHARLEPDAGGGSRGCGSSGNGVWVAQVLGDDRDHASVPDPAEEPAGFVQQQELAVPGHARPFDHDLVAIQVAGQVQVAFGMHSFTQRQRIIQKIDRAFERAKAFRRGVDQLPESAGRG